MSTNKSEHLNLHLWEPEDDFLRTEFNENFEKIDETCGAILTPAGKASACGSFLVSGSTENGSTVLSLDFEPRYIILGVSTLHLVLGGSSGSISIVSGGSTYSVSFQIYQNMLKIISKDSRISTQYTVKYVVFP